MCIIFRYSNLFQALSELDYGPRFITLKPMNIFEAIETRRALKHPDPNHQMPEADVARLIQIAKQASSPPEPRHDRRRKWWGWEI
jgi:hypothetical protein